MDQEASPTSDGIVTKASPRSVDQTVDRLTRLVAEKGLTLFAVIDHSGEARAAGFEMPDTKPVIFGSQAGGTPVMLAAPLAALDLSLKALVWADSDGRSWLSYNSPGYLATRHHLTDDLRGRLDPIQTLSDAAVAVDA